MAKQTARNPLYVQVAEFVLQQIAAGVYRPHHAIPTEWQLAKKLDVSQGTVRKGLDDLVARHILYRQQGVGTFVGDQYGDWGRFGLVGVHDHESHLTYPKSEVLSIVAVHAPADVIAALSMRQTGASLVWRILVVWRYQIHLVAMDEVYLSYERFGELNRRQLSTRMSIGDLLLKEYEVRLNTESCVMSVGGLSTEQASILKVSSEEAVLFLRIKCADASGEAVMVKRRYVLTRHYHLNFLPATIA